jgi:hypothetical protein
MNHPGSLIHLIFNIFQYRSTFHVFLFFLFYIIAVFLCVYESIFAGDFCKTLMKKLFPFISGHCMFHK